MIISRLCFSERVKSGGFSRAEAESHSLHFIPSCPHRLNHHLQPFGALRQTVVQKDDGARAQLAADAARDFGGGGAVGVIGADGPAYGFEIQVFDSLADGWICNAKRRAEKRCCDASGLLNGLLAQTNVGKHTGAAEKRKAVCVAKTVDSNLMPFVGHTLEQSLVASNAAADAEKCGFGIVAFQHVEHTGCLLCVGAVVKCQIHNPFGSLDAAQGTHIHLRFYAVRSVKQERQNGGGDECDNHCLFLTDLTRFYPIYADAINRVPTNPQHLIPNPKKPNY